ncbi:MAG: hypothetical protein DWQ07_23140 [Chloroflexi bacterium]|nr:MAG: hypothetical protein DWQ07_23140 [Chloroflexota bacterium]MBL1194045.1 hypothetical protein [Chloroflexota bacterium]NOH11339.1 hypothetical protein [Chloroflexota bacterium]
MPNRNFILALLSIFALTLASCNSQSASISTATPTPEVEVAPTQTPTNEPIEEATPADPCDGLSAAECANLGEHQYNSETTEFNCTSVFDLKRTASFRFTFSDNQVVLERLGDEPTSATLVKLSADVYGYSPQPGMSTTISFTEEGFSNVIQQDGEACLLTINTFVGP